MRVTPEGTKAANYAFDVTPMMTWLVTERGVCEAEGGVLRRMLGDVV